MALRGKYVHSPESPFYTFTCREGNRMRVEPSQVVPGCILLKDINGKTSRPMVRRDDTGEIIALKNDSSLYIGEILH